jgi:hypothetical protein
MVNVGMDINEFLFRLVRREHPSVQAPGYPETIEPTPERAGPKVNIGGGPHNPRERLNAALLTANAP